MYDSQDVVAWCGPKKTRCGTIPPLWQAVDMNYRSINETIVKYFGGFVSGLKSTSGFRLSASAGTGAWWPGTEQ
jgi:hypothetical protein